MKGSAVLTIIILAIGLTAGLMQRQQLAALRLDRKQLAAQAVRLGIDPASPDPSGPTGAIKREVQDREALMHSVLAQVLDYGRALNEDETIDGESSSAVQEMCRDLMERLMDLDPEDLRQVIGSLQADEDLPSRQELIDLSVRMLAENHPAAALSLLASSEDLTEQMDDGPAVIGESLANWAKKDPGAALSWAQENSGKNLPLSPGEMESNALAGAARLDPQLAFKLLSRVTSKTDDAIQAITGSARSPDARTAILTALRNHLTTISDPAERDSLRDKALGGFAGSFSGERYDSAVNWISSQAFSAGECDQLVRNLSYETTKAETGKWVEWMARTLPPDKLEERVGLLVSSWVQDESQVVGKWLNEQADGPVKAAAVKAFARAVGEIDPQVATQWAVTMPAGQEREETLKRIYQKWLNKDPAAANAALEGMGLSAETLDSLKKQSGAVDDH